MAKRSIAVSPEVVSHLHFCDSSEQANAAMQALEKAHAIGKLLNAANGMFDVSKAAVICGDMVAGLIDEACEQLGHLPQLVGGARHD